MIDGELSRATVPPEVRAWPRPVVGPVLRYHPRLPNSVVIWMVARGVTSLRRR